VRKNYQNGEIDTSAGRARGFKQVEDCGVQAGEQAVLRRRLSVHGWRDRLSGGGWQLFGRACFGSTGRSDGGVCVEVWHLDGEDVEHDGEGAGVCGRGYSDTRGLTGVVAEPFGGTTHKSAIVAVAVRLLRLRVCWHRCSSRREPSPGS
jgi:hypothetical protein